MRKSPSIVINLNIQLDGPDAAKLEQLSRLLDMSKRETGKLIITNTLDAALDAALESSEITDQQEETLNESEQPFDQTVVNLAVPKIEALESGNTFEVKQLLGKAWLSLHRGDKNRFGKAFRRLVDEGVITGVVFVGIKPNRHAEYAKK